MQDTFQYNVSRWPILEVTFPKHEITLEDIRQYLQTLETYFDRNEVLLLIIDITESGWVSTPLRIEISKWIMADKVRLRKYVAGTAYVVKKKILRLALQTFLSFDDISKVIGPIKVFNTIDNARSWAQEIISAKN